jgi:hypothetical protein
MIDICYIWWQNTNCQTITKVSSNWLKINLITLLMLGRNLVSSNSTII